MTKLEQQGLAAKNAERVLAVAGTAKKNEADVYKRQQQVSGSKQSPEATTCTLACVTCVTTPFVLVVVERCV